MKEFDYAPEISFIPFGSLRLHTRVEGHRTLDLGQEGR